MKIDTKEFELPDTLFIRDIEPQVFQTIVVEALSKIKGVTLAGGALKEILGWETPTSSVLVEQDLKRHVVNVRIEVSIAHGEPIPAKAEEIQSLVALELTRMTGLHVGSIHVVVKDLYFPGRVKEKVMKEHSEYTEEL